MIDYSFVIPVYNCKQYIEECVDSVINTIRLQPFLCEIILVNDGSTDGSADLCEKLAKKNPVIRVFNQKNSGVSVARNQGIDSARGEYIIFMDADDTIVPEKMADLFQKIKKEKSIDMAVFGLKYNYIENGILKNTTCLSPAITGKYYRNEWSGYLVPLYQSNALTSVWSRIIKSSILRNNSVQFNEQMISFEDLDFTLRAMSYCNQILFVPDLIYNYEVRVGDGKYQKRMNRIKSIKDVIDAIEQSLHSIKDDEETDNILISVYALLLKDKQVGKTKEEILRLLDDFKLWVDIHGFQEQIFVNRDLKAAYQKKYYLIRFRRKYYAIRHKIASAIKQKIHYVGNHL